MLPKIGSLIFDELTTRYFDTDLSDSWQLSMRASFDVGQRARRETYEPAFSYGWITLHTWDFLLK